MNARQAGLGSDVVRPEPSSLPGGLALRPSEPDDGRSNSVEDFLHLLRLRNVELRVEEDELRIRAPRGVLNREDLESIRQLKSKIIETLEQRQILEAPIRPRRAGCLVPLTVMQERFWHIAVNSNNGLARRYCTAVMRVS